MSAPALPRAPLTAPRRRTRVTTTAPPRLTTPRYTRVTLVGTRRRVDVVVPSDEPVGRLLPEVIRLTGEPPTAPPSLRHLAALDGTLLDADATLAEAGVRDGAQLRLVGLADAPPPPVVHDVVEETADDLDRRHWRWGAGSRHGLAATVLAVGGALAVHLVAGALHGSARAAALIALPAVLLLIGAAAGRMLPAPVGLALLVGGGATGGLAVVELAAGPDAIAVGLAMVAALVTLAIGLGTRYGRGPLIGGVTGLALVAGWTLAEGAGAASPLVAAGAAVVSIAMLGLLPRLALVSSGLTALDDRRARDVEVSRRDVTAALTAAHRGLALAVAAAALSAGAAGWVLAAHRAGWTTSLAVLLALALVLRARSFPLVGPVLALAAAAVTTSVALVYAERAAIWPVTAIVVVVTVGTFAGLVGEPAEHVRARVRRIADRLELLVVVASVPVALGVSGLYSHLLRVF
jgi:type VII secretion integral membrane protein EccD